MNSVNPNLVVLAVCPRLHGEMLRAVFEPLPSISTTALCGDSLHRSIQESIQEDMDWSQVRWLLLSVQEKGQLPLTGFRLLEKFPGLSILAISDGGEWISIFSQRHDGRVHRAELHNISLQTLTTILDCFPVHWYPDVTPDEEQLAEMGREPGEWVEEDEVSEASWESFPASDPPANW